MVDLGSIVRIFWSFIGYYGSFFVFKKYSVIRFSVFGLLWSNK